MAGPDLMCVGSSDSSKNVLKVIYNISANILVIKIILYF